MKKYLSYTLVLIAIAGIFLPQTAAARGGFGQAENYEECMEDWRNNPGTRTQATTERDCQIRFNSEIAYNEDGSVKGDINNSSWVITSIVQPALAWVVTTMLKFVSLLTGLGGLVLNGAIYHTVVNVTDNYTKIGVINEAWGVIRDIANMGFIFVLLYAAIQTIIGIGGDTKGLIVRVIVVAILINFSLFFTKVVIDIANLLALTFYDAIVPNAASQGLTGLGLSNAFMQHLNLQNLYHVEGADDLTPLAIITTGIMGSIMLLIAAFVFFAVALLFIIRYVVLIMVLILSPIAFVSFVLPKMDQYRKQWSDALVNQSFFAPVYLALTWVTLRILSGVTTAFGASGANLANVGGVGLNPNGSVSPGSIGFFPTLINFAVIIAFLIISLVIAKEWSGKTAGGVGKLASWATGAAGSVTLGAAGRFGRGTFGRAGQALAENEWLKERAPTSRLARLGLAASRKTAGASFDMRAAGFASQLDAGKGQKGGFAKDLEDKAKDEKKYADSLKPSEILVSRAERALDEAKKGTDPDKIRKAEAEVDRLKGASEEDIRKREIKRIREKHYEDTGELKGEKQIKKDLELEENKRRVVIRDLKRGGMTHEEATEEAKNLSRGQGGWAPEKIKGVTVDRKEAYAKDKETSSLVNIPIPGTGKVIPFSFTGRVGMIGKVKRERLEEAIAIRKSIKEKKPAEKLAEEIKTQTESVADETAGGDEPRSVGSGQTPGAAANSGSSPTPNP